MPVSKNDKYEEFDFNIDQFLIRWRIETLERPAENKKSVGEVMQAGLGHGGDGGAGRLHLPPNSLNFGLVLRLHLDVSLHVMQHILTPTSCLALSKNVLVSKASKIY